MSQSNWLGRISLSPPTHSQGATCPSSFFFPSSFSFLLLSFILPHARRNPPSWFLLSPEPLSPLLLFFSHAPAAPSLSLSSITHRVARERERERERERDPVWERNLRLRKTDSWPWVERFWSWVVRPSLWHGDNS